MKIIAGSICVLGLLAFSGCGDSTGDNNDDSTKIQPIMISEILAANDNSIKDPDFDKNADYIELYNANATAIDIGGYGLSDGEKTWRFPEGTKIEPQAYLLVWADKEDTKLHTNFKLSADGEMVILYAKGSEKVVDKIVFEKQFDDVALGRDKDHNNIFLKPTPNHENEIDKNKVNPRAHEDVNPQGSLIISEFMASNVNSAYDSKNFQFSDWIELYNNGDTDLDIGGYKISDKKDKEGWTIPLNTTIKSKDFLIVWADKSAEGLHTNFSLSSDGEAIYLSNVQDETIDSVAFEKQKSNVSYGRDLESLEWGYMLPTFKAKNSKLYTDKRSKKPKFSEDGKFYDSAITVGISSKDGGEIHYTTDGAIPDKSSAIYSAPILLDKTSVLRSVSYAKGKLPSKIKTATFFINEESTLPVVSLATNSEYLYDDTIGIYVKGTNGARRNVQSDTEKYNFEQDWFRPVYFSIYENNEKVFSENIEFAISGGSSRFWNAKKSFRFELDDAMEYKPYASKSLDNIKDFKLRTGHGAFQIGDLLANDLVQQGGLNVDYQAYKTVNMFMNGEFWGVYNMREKRGSEYIASNYPSISKKKVDIVQAGQVRKGDRTEHDEMREFLSSHDLSVAANYAMALEMIDEDNFIDYLCINLYSANHDWVGSNNSIWKEQKEGAKWRWMLDDVDLGFQKEFVSENMFTYVSNYPFETLLKDMFNAFNQSPTFKSKFKARYNTLLNGALSKNSILQRANKLISDKEAYITKGKFATSQDTYDTYVSDLRTFINQREDIVRENLEHF